MVRPDPLMPCDCLNHCGDDPWLKTGAARQCDWRRRQDVIDKMPSDAVLRLAMIAFGLLANAGETFTPALVPVVRRLKPELERLIPDDFDCSHLVAEIFTNADAAICARQEGRCQQ